jgi:hypothetical protein
MACAHQGRSSTVALGEQIKDIIVLTAGLQHIVHHLQTDYNNLEDKNMSLRATNEEQAVENIGLKRRVSELRRG